MIKELKPTQKSFYLFSAEVINFLVPNPLLYKSFIKTMITRKTCIAV